jgi:cysteine-S-conjugate beta-lyase
MGRPYNFDEIIDRSGTNSLKYDLREKLFGNGGLTPMWVADMDFKVADFVVKAIQDRVSHEIYGYALNPESLYDSIINWIYTHHQWQVKREWIGFTPGVVPALNMAVLAFTNPGDKIIIQTPVYPPFYTAATDHQRELVTNPLVLRDGRYCMDLNKLINQIDNRTKLLVLCSPHNPTGNVWKDYELKDLAEICIRKNILIISDEIHADIVYPGHKHTPLASISEEISSNVVTLMAASKTFNFAGLNTSYFITSERNLYRKLQQTVDRLHLGICNLFGNIATEAAYLHGEEWLSQLISYLEKNIVFAEKFINSNIPEVKIIKPEATFLLWTDFREIGLKEDALKHLIIHKAGLGFSDGTIFGQDGSGFQRINIACPKSVLENALIRLKKALQDN